MCGDREGLLTLPQTESSYGVAVEFGVELVLAPG
jgi:hypothetical protein